MILLKTKHYPNTLAGKLLLVNLHPPSPKGYFCCLARAEAHTQKNKHVKSIASQIFPPKTSSQPPSGFPSSPFLRHTREAWSPGCSRRIAHNRLFGFTFVWGPGFLSERSRTKRTWVGERRHLCRCSMTRKKRVRLGRVFVIIFLHCW